MWRHLENNEIELLELTEKILMNTFYGLFM